MASRIDFILGVAGQYARSAAAIEARPSIVITLIHFGDESRTELTGWHWASRTELAED